MESDIQCRSSGSLFAFFLNAGVAVLQGYAERKLHLGPTSDPAHQVRK